MIEPCTYFLAEISSTLHIIGACLTIPAGALGLLLAFRWKRDRRFVEQELRRHGMRIDVAVRNLQKGVHPSHAYATLAWSQSDLMLVAAKHLMSDEQRLGVGALFALAAHTPLHKAKDTVFTEKPRALIGSMPEETAVALRRAAAGISSGEGSLLVAGPYQVIAYNQVVCHRARRDKRCPPAWMFVCRHPLISPNLAQQACIATRLHDAEVFAAVDHKKDSTASRRAKDEGREPRMTSFERFRIITIRQSNHWLWRKVLRGEQELDPGVGFASTVIEMLGNAARSRPFFVDYDMFPAIDRSFAAIATAILDRLRSLLGASSDASGASSQKTAELCSSLSQDLERAYRILGLDFAWLSHFMASGPDPLKSIFGTTAAPTTKQTVRRRKSAAKARRETLKDPALDITGEADAFSAACNELQHFASPQDEDERIELLHSGFWNSFGLMNHGDLSTVAAVLALVDRDGRFHTADRIVGIAWGGLVLASTITLALADTEGEHIPLSIMSVHPVPRFEPLPRPRERMVVVDSAIHSGFTARVLAHKFGPFIVKLKPDVCRYLVGLAPRGDFMPLVEPEFRRISRDLVSLAYCPTAGEFDKTKEDPELADSDALASVDRDTVARYAAYLQQSFAAASDDQAAKMPSDFWDEATFTTKMQVPVLRDDVGQWCKKETSVWRQGACFDNTAILKRVSGHIHDILGAADVLKDDPDDRLLVILGSRNAVPFGVGLWLHELARRRGRRSRLWFVAARGMGTCLPHFRAEHARKFRRALILDSLIKDGLVGRTVAQSVLRAWDAAREGNHQGTPARLTTRLGLLAVVVSRTGPSAVERSIAKSANRYRNKKLEVLPLWPGTCFARAIHAL